MNIEEFMQRIDLPEECREAVRRERPARSEVEALPALLRSEPCEISPARALALLVHFLAEHGERAYRVRGSTPAEFLETMSDLTLWCRRLRFERGEIGVRELGWLGHLVRADIFRLGRLQFVPRITEARFPGNIGRTDVAAAPAFPPIGREDLGELPVFPAGTRYCEVHIPDGPPLDPADVDRSFARAQARFAPAFLTCESWLLSPRLQDMVPSGNIVAFAARFRLLHFDAADRSAERYIFGRVGAPSGYRPESRLAAQVQAHALRGEFVGSGYGYAPLSSAD